MVIEFCSDEGRVECIVITQNKEEKKELRNITEYLYLEAGIILVGFFFSHSNQQTVVDILDKAVLDHECLPVLYLWLNWVIYSKLAIVQK